MMHILFIAPYPEIRDTIKSALARHPRRDEIIPRVIDGSAEELHSMSLSPCDAIVLRGFSARKIREEKNLDVPVVEIDISGYDVVTAVQECRDKYNARQIAFVGFYNAFYGITKFDRLLGCGIKLYASRNLAELPGLLRQARREGCDAVIGGYSAHQFATAMGMPSIGLASGEDSVGLALDEAVRVVELVRQERIKAETYRIITQSMKDGAIYVDAEGFVREANRAATALACTELKGKLLAALFPRMERNFLAALRSGKEFTNDLSEMGGITVSLDYVPVVVHGKSAGVVISFQNITKVQQREGKIRKKLHEKGMVAKYTFANIVHTSRAIGKTIELARRYATLESNILITGETGTGKELFAQSIHNESRRKDGPFVAVNCAALPESLLESELFGYVEGAFTGTSKGGKTGLFELAHGGTLFLDEIAEIPVGVQGKLLRVLQEREVRRIGASKVMAVDVRIICATNSALSSLVEKGRFRRDLFYRLNVFNISLPPLRVRKDDITALFTYFLRSFCRANALPVPAVQPAALELLHGCPLDGNARQLRNITTRVCVLRDNPAVLTTRDMELAVYPEAAYQSRDAMQGERAGGQPYERTSEQPEKPEDNRGASPAAPKPAVASSLETTLQALALCNGNKGKAAAMLGINRSTLWRRLRDHQ